MQRAPWWERFGDPLLNQLERQLTAENPDLAALAEQYTQARDLAAEARSGLFPQLTASGLMSDNKESQYRLFHNPHSTFQTEEASNVIQATASWEPDFWSQIRNKTKAQKQLAQASAATLATARLSLQAELANDYIALRGYDGQAAIYRASIANYEKAVKITKERLQGSIASALDVARSKSQLASTQALQSGLLGNRAVLQHAIAVLIGTNPSSFAIPEDERSRLVSPPFRWACRPACCSAGRTLPAPSGRWLPRTPRLVFRAPPSTPTSPSARLPGSRITGLIS